LLEKTAHLAADCIPKASFDVHAFAVRIDSVPMGASECLSTSAFYALLQSHIAHAARAMNTELTELFQNVFSTARISTREYPALKIAHTMLRSTDFARKYSAFEQIFKRNPGGKEPTLRAIAFSLAYQNSYINMPNDAQKAQAQLMFDRTSKLYIESDIAFGSTRLKEGIKNQIADILKIPASHISIKHALASHPNTIPLISSSGIAIFSNLIRKASERLQHQRFREGLPLSLHSYSLIKPTKAENFGNIVHPSFGAAILEAEYDVRTSIIQSITLDVSVYAGKILSPPRAKASIREDCLRALGGCLHANISNNASIDDIYSTLLLKSVLNVNLIEDERASIARPIGNLAYALVLSCFHSVLEQTTTSNRIHLPFSPTSPIVMPEGIL
jgi:CO/xanthine dehydrogenase Mo-binding subunit